MNLIDKQNKAINDIISLIVLKFGNEKNELKTLDAISTCARLAGSFMFRSFDFQIKDAKPGSIMLSENANVKGVELVNITYSVLQSYGVMIDNEKMNNDFSDATNINFLDAINLVQNEALEIMNKNDMSYEMLAQSAAVATAYIIKQSPNITGEIGFGTAVFYCIEGSKTFPPNFNSNDNTSNQTNFIDNNSEIKTNQINKKPWWKIW